MAQTRLQETTSNNRGRITALRLLRVTLLTLTSLHLIAPAHALTTREKLEKWCTSSTGSVAGAGRCLGYLLAAEDALSQDSIEGVRACLPENITLQEQNHIVIEWLKSNPTAEAKTAMGLVARAYAANYPCK